MGKQSATLEAQKRIKSAGPPVEENDPGKDGMLDQGRAESAR